MAVPFQINGVRLDGSSTLPALKFGGATYSRQAVDSANTGRNQSGELIRDLITQKDKWRLEFAPCSSTQLTALLNQIDSAFFTFTSPFGSKTFYVGDRTAGVLKIDKNGNAVWGNISFDIIER